MESKSRLSPSGCFAKALMDEPMFILLARDKCAPDVIRFWADRRAQTAVEESGSQDAEQLTEALEAADGFEQWRIEHDGEWRGHQGHVPDLAPTPTDEIASIAGTILGRHALDADAAAAGVPVNGEKFNSLLADAKKLAGFVMRADRQAGPNHG